MLTGRLCLTLSIGTAPTVQQNTNCYVAAGPCFINGLDQNSRSPQLPADSGETEFHSLGQDVVYIDTTFSSGFSLIEQLVMFISHLQ